MLKIIRYILLALWLIVVCTYGIILGLLIPNHPKLLKHVSRLVVASRFFMGIKILLRNEHIFYENSPSVVISNHQSNLDIFPGGRSLPDKTYTIGKKAILYIPFFGLFYYLCGNILIDRSNKKKAFGVMDKAVTAITEDKKSIWIMPEGTRSKGRGLLPFKKGPFVTAIKSQRPIVIVAISNYVKTLNLNKWHAGTILVDVLPPIFTENKTPADVDALKEEAYEKMLKATLALDSQLASNKIDTNFYE